MGMVVSGSGGTAARPWVLVCALPLLVCGSCLGPSFVAGLGAEPVTLLAPPSGFVTVVFDNDSDATIRLLANVETNDGLQQINYGERFDNPLTSGVPAASEEIRAFECEVLLAESVSLEVLVPVDVAVLDFVPIQTVGGGSTRRLEQVATIPIGFLPVELSTGFPAIEEPQCGSNVIFQLIGSLVIPEREYFDVVSGQTVTGPAFIQGVDPAFPRITDFVLRAQIQ